MVKRIQIPPKLLSIPKGGMYHTFILPEKEPWYIVWLANGITLGAVIGGIGYVAYLVSISY